MIIVRTFKTVSLAVMTATSSFLFAAPAAIFIDPGHTKTTSYGTGILGDEYLVTLPVAEHLADLLVSIHFDYIIDAFKASRATRKGFHVTVSPYSGKLPQSVSAARAVAAALADTYTVNRSIEHNTPHISAAVQGSYDLPSLLASGVNMRSLIILGDAFEHAYCASNTKALPYPDIPSVLIECAFLHEEAFLSEAAKKELAERIYTGIVKWHETSQ